MTIAGTRARRPSPPPLHVFIFYLESIAWDESHVPAPTFGTTETEGRGDEIPGLQPRASTTSSWPSLCSSALIVFGAGSAAVGAHPLVFVGGRIDARRSAGARTLQP
jgi:hypothetical protein